MEDNYINELLFNVLRLNLKFLVFIFSLRLSHTMNIELCVLIHTTKSITTNILFMAVSASRLAAYILSILLSP